MILNKNKELKSILSKRDECKDQFKRTTKKANGYLKQKVKDVHPAFSSRDGQ